MIRRYSYVCRRWQGEAQYLLFKTPILFCIKKDDFLDPMPQVESFLGGTNEGERKVCDLQVRWFHFEHQVSNVATKCLLGHEAVVGLTSLSLHGLHLDVDLLYSLKNLETLTLHRITFEPSTNITPLTQLRHLSLISFKHLPPCLELPQLPSLTALACLDLSGFDTKATLLYIDRNSQKPLQLFSIRFLELHFFRSDDEVRRLADFTLVDITIEDFTRAMTRLPVDMPFKHLRFDYGDTLPTAEDNYWWSRLWKGPLLDAAVDLETIVVPSAWYTYAPDMTLVEEFTKRRNIKLLVEEDWSETRSFERQLSKVFMEDRGIV